MSPQTTEPRRTRSCRDARRNLTLAARSFPARALIELRRYGIHDVAESLDVFKIIGHQLVAGVFLDVIFGPFDTQLSLVLYTSPFLNQ